MFWTKWRSDVFSAPVFLNLRDFVRIEEKRLSLKMENNVFYLSMEYNNHVICGIFHVRTNFYENLEYVLGNLTSPLIVK